MGNLKTKLAVWKNERKTVIVKRFQESRCVNWVRSMKLKWEVRGQMKRWHQEHEEVEGERGCAATGDVMPLRPAPWEHIPYPTMAGDATLPVVTAAPYATDEFYVDVQYETALITATETGEGGTGGRWEKVKSWLLARL